MENEDKFPRGRYLLELDSVLDYPLRLQDSLLDFNTNNMLFSNDGRWLVSVPFGRGIAFLTDVSGSSPGSTFIELTGNRRLISAIAFSPDNHWLATGHGNQIYLWDLTSMDPSASPRVIQGHTNTIWSLAFSPNGQTLASGSRDKTIRLWDMNARNITTSAIILNGHTAEVYDIAFTDNGSRLISNSLDGTTRIWNLDFEEMVAQACEEAGRNFTEDEWALYFEGEPYHKTCQK